MTLPPIYKIHPAIGIARVGNATTFFIGPEIPGLRPTGELPGTKVPPYKDEGKIKPQASRFRIFEYVEKNGDYIVNREISLSEKDVTNLSWTVHLANRKGSFFKFDGLKGEEVLNSDKRNSSIKDRRKLEIDPGPRSISGKNSEAVEFSKGTSSDPIKELWPEPTPFPEITTLGRLLTDDHGRLIVIGGSGKTASFSDAEPIKQYANNDGWFDDVSDGPVTADLELNGKQVTVEPAWIICGPPDFAPHLGNVVTLYDLLYDLAARNMTLPENETLYKTGTLQGLFTINKEFKKSGEFILSDYIPDFVTEIYPILYHAFSMKFLFAPLANAHLTLTDLKNLGNKDAKFVNIRKAIFNMIRNPNEKPMNGLQKMPKLLGDEPYGDSEHPRFSLYLTQTQYALLKQWSVGNFLESEIPDPNLLNLTITPEGLDRASLENCVGGAFYPGIEVGWQIRNASIFSEPFRIKHGISSPYVGDEGNVIRAGHFTRQIALPWQADFLQCKSEDERGSLWGWWPGQRPDSVFANEEDYKSESKIMSPWHRASKAKIQIKWPIGFEEANPKMPSYQEMLNNWTKFGFILEIRKDVFIENERDDDIP